LTADKSHRNILYPESAPLRISLTERKAQRNIDFFPVMNRLRQHPTALVSTLSSLPPKHFAHDEKKLSTDVDALKQKLSTAVDKSSL